MSAGDATARHSRGTALLLWVGLTRDDVDAALHISY